MLYYVVRVILVFVIMFFIKTKVFKKEKILLFVISVLAFVSVCLIPFENFIISFETPKAVFDYTCFGKISDIVNGNESSMVYYEKGENTYSYMFVRETNGKYKIMNQWDAKKVSYKFGDQAFIEVYNFYMAAKYFF